VIRTGWATVSSDADEEWHAFAADDDSARPVPAQCARITLPAAGLDDLEPVPRGRPCFACLIAATEELPPVGRMGSAS
jgi:hypothetical protein